MADRLFVASQDAITRGWHTIARVTKRSSAYELQFTKGALALESLPADLFGMRVEDTYRFRHLIPLLLNKLPPKSRSDYGRMLRWLGLSGQEDDFTLLSKFGLIAGTDGLIFYPEPEIKNGVYHLNFFVHAIRHMHPDALPWCEKAKVGDRLLPVLDLQNPADENAVALRPADAPLLVGYIPAFYAADLRTILADRNCAKAAIVRVEYNNEDAPVQLRLFCSITVPVPEGFLSMQSEEHQPVASSRGKSKSGSASDSDGIALFARVG